MAKNILSLLNYFDRRMLINIGVLLGTIAVFILLFLMPTVKTNRVLRNKMTELENNIIRSVRKVNEFPKLNEEKIKAESVLNDYLGKMIKEGQQTRLMGDISDIAKQSHVKIVSIKPYLYDETLPEGFTDNFKSYSYEMFLESGYHQLGAFLTRVQAYKYFIRIDKIYIKPNEDKPREHNIKVFFTTFAKI